MGNESAWRRLRRVFGQDPAAEVHDELQFHLDERIRNNIARGMEPEAARKAALERLGDLERVRSECTAAQPTSVSNYAPGGRLDMCSTLWCFCGENGVQ